MTQPVRPPRRPRFDLRATTLYFTLAALALVAAGLLARTAAAAAERRPVWAVSVALIASAVALRSLRGRRRRTSATRYARRAAAALAAGARTAADDLDRTVPALAVPTAVPLNAVEVPAVTAVLPDPEPVPALDWEDLDADAFEEAIAGLCERDGCREVEVVGGAGDLGADVLGLAPDGRRIVVQCKRYAADHKVGSQDLQRFGGTCFTVHAADTAVLVTTSEFTAPALDYAAQCGILCFDGRDLRAWHEGSGPAPWDAVPEGEGAVQDGTYVRPVAEA
ncbi:restriction endonuclease [Streptomyces sp. J2-1]|uniref:restriction endonuclease n=1 Tax=Streptomyces corallincola TaxID=2851888 RepID=UPI001C385EAB|nr:restriction endonuclease [Streptomyces corallincola]MBV2354064.1 restriction endonuclease [Streptomyces corallincola]